MAAIDIVTAVAASFGYLSLKPLQKEIISCILKGNDAFAIQPTGYGKSLCFTCLPRAFDWQDFIVDGSNIVVVVSPLKALIENQVRLLQALLDV